MVEEEKKEMPPVVIKEDIPPIAIKTFEALRKRFLVCGKIWFELGNFLGKLEESPFLANNKDSLRHVLDRAEKEYVNQLFSFKVVDSPLISNSGCISEKQWLFLLQKFIDIDNFVKESKMKDMRSLKKEAISRIRKALEELITVD